MIDSSVREVFSKVIEEEHIETDEQLVEWVRSHVGYLNYEQTIIVRKHWHTMFK